MSVSAAQYLLNNAFSVDEKVLPPRRSVARCSRRAESSRLCERFSPTLDKAKPAERPERPSARSEPMIASRRRRGVVFQAETIILAPKGDETLSQSQSYMRNLRRVVGSDFSSAIHPLALSWYATQRILLFCFLPPISSSGPDIELLTKAN